MILPTRCPEDQAVDAPAAGAPGAQGALHLPPSNPVRRQEPHRPGDALEVARILTQACCKALCQAISPERIDDKVNEDALAPSPMSRVGSL
jgi:hypothetical protein